MKDPKQSSITGFKIGLIGMALVLLLLFLTSCGSYQSVTVKQVNETNFVTSENNTITAKRRVLYNLQENAIYKMKLKDGKCLTVKSKIK